ncbi:hypothetical protein NSZ01_19950 [Nocardioides szechwanensis]|nr:HAMP domain-containing sensor histidine kinase [Nocardioides szechwanensis]GEP34227.1 hypothetical protein NSZ01_19950 [Nocardioides szechwanensis]
MSTDRRRLPMTWASTTVIVLTILAATATVLIGRQLNRLEAERDASTAAADILAAVAEDVRTTADSATAEASAGVRASEVGAAFPEGVADSSAVRARDSAQPVLDDSGEGVVVVASYDTAVTPATVQERRDHVVAYAVVPLDLAGTLLTMKPSEGGIAVAGPDRQVMSVPDHRPSDAAFQTVDLGSGTTSGWTLTVWTTPPQTPAVAWLIALGLGLTGTAAAGWMALRRERDRRSRDDLLRLQEASATVAELATVAQHSLDLAEVLPAVSAELGAALGLRGLSVGVPSADGERLLFVWGERPDNVPADHHPRDEVGAGDTIALVLSRGGRLAARLLVVAGRRLTGPDLRTLFAAGDVLTSALANAEMYSQQSELLKRMRSVDELKTVFLATASHELRTPVVAITGYAQVLTMRLDELTPEQTRMYVERVDANAQRLGALVEDLLDFSKLERGTDVEDHAPLDLGEVVSRILEEQPDLAPDHLVSHSTVRGLGVIGSRLAVDRVVSNLVGNAAKYSPAGSAIRVRVQAAHGRAELIVDDEGSGVPHDEREQIFSRFFRGHGDVVVRTSGAGLGLAIVSEFAASMGGQVSVADADGGGARFVVSYPLAASRAEPSRGATDADT